ncbi:MAG: hypothetical protein CMF22_10405 [Idiomarinaceae bacterium]|nr:hypothetical protein [Idiomarinaceae bacterium]MBG23852.1 hypothetical protein [Idiomarinaceae bacterium]
MKRDAAIHELNTKHRKSTWHVLHFIATVLFWPWLIVWLVFWGLNTAHNKAVDIAIRNLYNNFKPEDDVELNL